MRALGSVGPRSVVWPTSSVAAPARRDASFERTSTRVQYSGDAPKTGVSALDARRAADLHTRLAKLARVLGKDFDLTLVPGDGWAYEFDTNRITYPAAELLGRDERSVMGLICHELAHRRYSLPIDREALANPAFHFLWNAIEDVRINKLICERYAGVPRMMEALYRDFTDVDARERAAAAASPSRAEQFGLGLIYAWASGGERDPLISDDAVHAALDAAAPHIAEATRLPPDVDVKFDDLSEREVRREAAASFRVVRDKLWPIYRHLLEADVDERANPPEPGSEGCDGADDAGASDEASEGGGAGASEGAEASDEASEGGGAGASEGAEASDEASEGGGAGASESAEASDEASDGNGAGASESAEASDEASNGNGAGASGEAEASDDATQGGGASASESAEASDEASAGGGAGASERAQASEASNEGGGAGASDPAEASNQASQGAGSSATASDDASAPSSAHAGDDNIDPTTAPRDPLAPDDEGDARREAAKRALEAELSERAAELDPKLAEERGADADEAKRSRVSEASSASEASPSSTSPLLDYDGAEDVDLDALLDRRLDALQSAEADGDPHTYGGIRQRMESTIDALVDELSDRLTRDRLPPLVGHYKRGVFDLRRSIQVENRRRATGKSDHRVFLRRDEPEKLDTRIVFCIDRSGSMRNGTRGSKMQSAREAFVVFTEALDRLDLPCACLAYDSDVEIIREFDDRPEEPDYEAMLAKLQAGGDNNDTGALAAASEMLLREGGDECIVFFLTDGIAVDNHADFVREVQERDGIHVIGIGVGDGCRDVEETYDHHIRVPDAAQLPRAIGELLIDVLT